MKYPLNYKDEFSQTLLFWIMRFIRYKLTTLSNHQVLNKEMILQAIADKENISIKDYDYKGELPQFAKDRGYSDKDSFVEKYGKDKIVKNMIIQKAQDIVMDNAVYK